VEERLALEPWKVRSDVGIFWPFVDNRSNLDTRAIFADLERKCIHINVEQCHKSGRLGEVFPQMKQCSTRYALVDSVVRRSIAGQSAQVWTLVLYSAMCNRLAIHIAFEQYKK
jgi:hypothetical protein